MDQDTWVAVAVVLLVMVLGFGLFAGLGSEEPVEVSAPVVDENNGQINQPVTGSCRPTGCSGQICADQDVVSTCEFQPQYACYRSAACERQPSGVCGWTPTAALTTCLANPPQM